jgi:hypothetical protein
VYGGDFQLESVAFAIKIYKFADQWQIKTLMEKLDELFKYVDAAEILPIFELYSLLQKERAFFWCKYQVTQNVNKKLAKCNNKFYFPLVVACKRHREGSGVRTLAQPQLGECCQFSAIWLKKRPGGAVGGVCSAVGKIPS